MCPGYRSGLRWASADKYYPDGRSKSFSITGGPSEHSMKITQSRERSLLSARSMVLGLHLHTVWSAEGQDRQFTTRRSLVVILANDLKS